MIDHRSNIDFQKIKQCDEKQHFIASSWNILQNDNILLIIKGGKKIQFLMMVMVTFRIFGKVYLLVVQCVSE